MLLFLISTQYLEAQSSHPNTYPRGKHVPTRCCAPAGTEYTLQHLSPECKGCLPNKGSGTLCEDPVLETESELPTGPHSK